MLPVDIAKALKIGRASVYRVLRSYLHRTGHGRDRDMSDDCRTDARFQNHPDLVDQLEAILSSFYLDGEAPEWQSMWDRIQAVLRRAGDTPVDRFEALAGVLQNVPASRKP
jgi:hypothetical protein